MRLKLNRPLVVFDLETTGIDTSKDRIVEIAAKKLEINGEISSYHQLINPTIPIPEGASKVHGIYDDDVKDKPTFSQLAPEIAKFFQHCDIGGFNSTRFDWPLLVEEFLRTTTPFDPDNRKFVDAQRIFHKKEPRDLTAAYQFYCKKELTNAHSADADTQATLEILLAQLERYTDLEPTIDALHAFSAPDKPFVDFGGRIVLDERNRAVFNFGKHKGVPVAEVLVREPGYYDWMMQGDFPLDLKRKLTQIKLNTIGR